MDEAPRTSRVRPDFMAPSPRVILEAGRLSSFEEAQMDDKNDPIGDLDDIRPTRYYFSDKSLGHLNRAIDENQFLQHMQLDNLPAPGREDTVLPMLWSYVQQNTSVIQWIHHKDLARQIREG